MVDHHHSFSNHSFFDCNSLYFFIEKRAKRGRKAVKRAAQAELTEKRSADEAEANAAVVPLDDDEVDTDMNMNIDKADEDVEDGEDDDEGGSCNCEQRMSSHLYEESKAGLPHYFRAGETIETAKAAFDRLQAGKKFGTGILRKVEKAMQKMVLGADTSELARSAAISPCRSWYWLLFMTALLIEADVDMTIEEIIFIIQSMLDFTFEIFSKDIAFVGTRGSAWDQMVIVGSKRSKRRKGLVAARAALAKVAPWGALHQTNHNGELKVDAMICVLKEMLTTNYFGNNVGKKKQKKLLAALNNKSFTVQNVINQIDVLLAKHGCSLWENGFWNLIQRAARGNPIIIISIRLLLVAKGMSSLPTKFDELNAFVNEAMDEENVTAAVHVMFPGGTDLPSRNLQRIAYNQGASFKVKKADLLPSGETRMIVDHRQLVVPTGYKVRKKTKKQRGVFYVATNSSDGFFFRSLADVYRKEGKELPMKEVRNKRKAAPARTQAAKNKKRKTKNLTISTTLKARSQSEKDKTSAKVRKTKSAKGILSSKDSFQASPENTGQWKSYSSSKHFVDSVFPNKTFKRNCYTYQVISKCLRGKLLSGLGYNFK